MAFSLLSNKTRGLQPSNGACITHAARGALQWAVKQRYRGKERPTPNQIQGSHSWKNRQVPTLRDEELSLSYHEKELESLAVLLDGRALSSGCVPVSLVTTPEVSSLPHCSCTKPAWKAQSCRKPVVPLMAWFLLVFHLAHGYAHL